MYLLDVSLYQRVLTGGFYRTKQGCHLSAISKFPDFSLTFYSFPYPLTDKKIIFILYFDGVNCINSNLGVTLKRKNFPLKVTLNE